MPDALGDGWLIAVVVGAIPLTLAAFRWVAAKWRAPLEKEKEKCKVLEAENRVLREEAVRRTDELYEEKIKSMLLESKLDNCQSDLKKWEDGRWGNR